MSDLYSPAAGCRIKQHSMSLSWPSFSWSSCATWSCLEWFWRRSVRWVPTRALAVPAGCCTTCASSPASPSYWVSPGSCPFSAGGRYPLLSHTSSPSSTPSKVGGKTMFMRVYTYSVACGPGYTAKVSEGYFRYLLAIITHLCIKLHFTYIQFTSLSLVSQNINARIV